MSVASRESAEWFKMELGKRFTIKSQLVGPGHDDMPEARLLGRVVRCTSQGWELEADQRHAEIINPKLGLKEPTKVVTTRVNEKSDYFEINREFPKIKRLAFQGLPLFSEFP